jgi:hypothetical protein
MTRADYEQLKGSTVEFFVRDIYLPDPAAILSELHDEETLTGKVVDLSDDARDETAAFVVVEVGRLREPCIVSAERVEIVARPSEPSRG